MTLAALERRIERGLTGYREAGAALREIRLRNLYRPEYGTFRQYCAQRWDMCLSRAYQLMDAASVAEECERVGQPIPKNEGQARKLIKIIPRGPRGRKPVGAVKAAVPPSAAVASKPKSAPNPTRLTRAGVVAAVDVLWRTYDAETLRAVWNELARRFEREEMRCAG